MYKMKIKLTCMHMLSLGPKLSVYLAMIKVDYFGPHLDRVPRGLHTHQLKKPIGDKNDTKLIQ